MHYVGGCPAEQGSSLCFIPPTWTFQFSVKADTAHYSTAVFTPFTFVVQKEVEKKLHRTKNHLFQ